MAFFDDYSVLDLIPPGLIDTVFTILQWAAVAGALMFGYFFFIHKPKKYKDQVEIWEATGSGIRILFDKGGWLVNKTDNTGVYSLLKNKNARLKAPKQEYAFTNKKGKLFYTYLKIGDGPHDYVQLGRNLEEINNEIKEKIEIIPASDLDWAKMNVKREMEKKNLGGWFSENKGIVIMGGVIGVSLLLILWIIGFGTDVIQTVASNVNENTIKQGEIAEALTAVANALGAKAQDPNIIAPPI